jgi:hypothetical protein
MRTERRGQVILLLRILKLLGSNLGPETGPELGLSCFFSVPLTNSAIVPLEIRSRQRPSTFSSIHHELITPSFNAI